MSPKRKCLLFLCWNCVENVTALITLDQSPCVLICLPKTTVTSRKPRFTLAVTLGTVSAGCCWVTVHRLPFKL